MTNVSSFLHLRRKKLVIEDIDYIVKSKDIKQSKRHTDFLRDIKSYNEEIKDMEEDIEMILLSSNKDKIILEECENYLQRKYKIHLATMPANINVLMLALLMIVSAILLALFFSCYLITNTNIDNINIGARIVGILTSLIATLTTSILMTNILSQIIKPGFENNYVASISAYEYCIEILKNAKLRADSLPLGSYKQFDRITVNPNKMNGQPCIRDMRLTVWRVIELLQTYPDRSELYREFPELTEEDINQAVIYADTCSKDPVVAKPIAHETLA
jgi:uncharacterized protein (DUF433 family)